MPFPLAAAFVPAAFQFGMGLIQNRKATRMDVQRPPAIPAAEREALELARLQANDQRMPGQSAAENQIRASTASAVNSAAQGGSGAAYQAAVANANLNEVNAMNDLSARGAQYMVDNVRNLQARLGRVGQYEDQAAQAKFNAEASTRSALQGGAMQNAFAGINNAVSTGLLLNGNKKDNDDGTGTAIDTTTQTNNPFYPWLRQGYNPMYGQGNTRPAGYTYPIPGYNGGDPWQQQPLLFLGQ